MRVEKYVGRPDGWLERMIDGSEDNFGDGIVEGGDFDS